MNRNILLLAIMAALTGCQSTGPILSKDNSIYSGRNSVLYQVQEQASSPEQAMQMGAMAYRAGAFDQALYQYLRAIELDPNSYDALVWVGRIHRERGNEHLAELAFSDVLRSDPDNAMALAEMGLLQLAMRRPGDAREMLGKALAADQKRLGGSAAQAPNGLKVDASSPLRVYNGLGVLADLDNDFARAAQYYGLARQIEPRSPLVANSQAYSAYLAGNWAEAETLYRQGISFDGRYEPLWRNYGLLLARMGRYEQALSTFEQVEGRAEASNDVGYICLIEGKLDVAEQFFRSAIDQSPAHFEMAWENLRRVEQIRRLRQDGVGQEGAAVEAFAVVPREKLQATP
ncbi:tetratricopeptide repeat protein [Pseudomonas sp. SO81]|uniref:tetratricopeptide repeat protein n=1 Tax=Pseudomonas sp. SO81 TaxID=2983246 RepID=UPI0025A4C443|nr:tetratricopeptide repeat protein [Pseudomonas sp. SO81]WJN57590.1 Flp pilus assembly protein TadD, contains TPR repeat [Pseudomonas sp. SO81]